jgi:hypothetical protein
MKISGLRPLTIICALAEAILDNATLHDFFDGDAARYFE